MEVTGVGGLSLREAWSRGAHAHLGIVVPGFPSLFMIYGPNTNTSGGSIIVYEEAQARYIRQALEEVRRRGVAAINVRPEVEAASDTAVIHEGTRTFPTTTSAGTVITRRIGRTYEKTIRRTFPAADPA